MGVLPGQDHLHQVRHDFALNTRVAHGKREANHRDTELTEVTCGHWLLCALRGKMIFHSDLLTSFHRRAHRATHFDHLCDLTGRRGEM